MAFIEMVRFEVGLGTNTSLLEVFSVRCQEGLVRNLGLKKGFTSKKATWESLRFS